MSEQKMFYKDMQKLINETDAKKIIKSSWEKILILHSSRR